VVWTGSLYMYTELLLIPGTLVMAPSSAAVSSICLFLHHASPLQWPGTVRVAARVVPCEPEYDGPDEMDNQHYDVQATVNEYIDGCACRRQHHIWEKLTSSKFSKTVFLSSRAFSHCACQNHRSEYLGWVFSIFDSLQAFQIQGK